MININVKAHKKEWQRDSKSAVEWPPQPHHLVPLVLAASAQPEKSSQLQAERLCWDDSVERARRNDRERKKKKEGGGGGEGNGWGKGMIQEGREGQVVLRRRFQPTERGQRQSRTHARTMLVLAELVLIGCNTDTDQNQCFSRNNT